MMQSIRAAGRLAWRPVTLSYIYLLGLSAAAPAIILGWQLGDEVNVLSPAYLHLVVWGQVLFLMPMLGATVNQITGSALTKPLVLTTPGLLKRLLHARVAVNVTFALAIAVALFLIGRAQDSIPSFCCALLFFEMGVLSSDPGAKRGQQLIVWVGGIVTLIFLRQTVLFLESEGVIVSIVALGFTVLLATKDLSLTRARERVQNTVPAGYPFGSPFTPIVLRNEGQDVAFGGHPSSGRTIDWLRALDYEMFGARRMGSAKELGFFILFFSMFAYLFSQTALPALMGILFIGTGRGLVGKFAYPISREERARIVFLNGVGRYAVYFGGAAIVTWLIANSSLPRVRYLDMADELNGFLALGSTFVWTPLAQYLTVKLKIERKVTFGTNQAKLMVLFLAIMFPAMATALLLPELHGGLPVQIGVFLLMIVTGHVLLWEALKRHFATADLV